MEQELHILQSEGQVNVDLACQEVFARMAKGYRL